MVVVKYCGVGQECFGKLYAMVLGRGTSYDLCLVFGNEVILNMVKGFSLSGFETVAPKDHHQHPVAQLMFLPYNLPHFK